MREIESGEVGQVVGGQTWPWPPEPPDCPRPEIPEWGDIRRERIEARLKP